MTRREVIGNATLYLGDCRDILPTLPKVDAVITDPPYGIAYQHSGGGAGTPGRRDRPSKRNALRPIHGDAVPFDPEHLFCLAEAVVMFGADHYRARLPDGGTFIAWDKHCGRGPNDSFADAEFLWTNLKVKRNVIRYLWKGVACEKAGEDGGRRYHPTTKPQGVMHACLDMVPDARLILDPYMGSGSTGVAAIARSLSFIGCEIDPDHFETACRRIEDAQRQGRLIA
jgi:site-specific DNA-methyltransferase (adenine-specific)/modification methylase